MPGHFLFEAQTGIIHHEPPQAPSNFYRYELPYQCLGRVKLAVERATVGSTGLEYPADFLAWLDDNDLASASA